MFGFRLFLNVFAVCLAAAAQWSAVAHGSDSTTESQSVLIEYEVYKDALKTGEPFLKRDLFLHVYNNRPYLDAELDFAVGQLEESAEEGYVPSQYTLGELLINGQVLEKDVGRGRNWLARAAEGGSGRAAFLIGRSYASEYYSMPNHRASDRRSTFESAEFWLTQADSFRAREPAVATAADVVLGRLYVSRSVSDENGWLLLERALDAGSMEAKQTLQALEDVLQDAVDDGHSSAATPLERVRRLLAPTS